MSTNQIEICPFCRGHIRQHASVCSGCGASKVAKASTLPPITVLFTSLIWVNCFGFIALVTGIGAFDLAFGEGYFSSAQYRWPAGRVLDVVLAVTVLFVGVKIYKFASRVWGLIFGSMADLVWVRR